MTENCSICVSNRIEISEGYIYCNLCGHTTISNKLMDYFDFNSYSYFVIDLCFICNSGDIINDKCVDCGYNYQCDHEYKYEHEHEQQYDRCIILDNKAEKMINENLEKNKYNYENINYYNKIIPITHKKNKNRIIDICKYYPAEIWLKIFKYHPNNLITMINSYENQFDEFIFDIFNENLKNGNIYCNKLLLINICDKPALVDKCDKLIYKLKFIKKNDKLVKLLLYKLGNIIKNGNISCFQFYLKLDRYITYPNTILNYSIKSYQDILKYHKLPKQYIKYVNNFKQLCNVLGYYFTGYRNIFNSFKNYI